MNRVLKVLSVAVVLFLGYMWVSILYKSCNKNDRMETFDDSISQEVPAYDEGLPDDPFFDQDDEIESTSQVNDDPIDYDALDQQIEQGVESTSSRDVKPTRVNDTTVSSSSSAGGRYMVIAGSYLEESNADVMVRKLGKLGYNNAEKVVFDLSQFHSVCAARYEDHGAAIQASTDLKNRGIDNYVHKRKS